MLCNPHNGGLEQTRWGMTEGLSELLFDSQAADLTTALGVSAQARAD